MAIQTKDQLEQARIALERRSPGELVAFILSLAQASNGIGDYVHAFAVADTPDASADLLRSELSFLQRGEREYDVRHRRSFEFVARVERLLDAIECILLPADPAAAFDLLAQFIESDEQIVDHCIEDDFGASEVFGRACELLLTVARTLPVAVARPVLVRLSADDPCGLRSRLASDSSS
jgi:hypothetical protein